MELKIDYLDIKFVENGKLKFLIIVGIRFEIICFVVVISKCCIYFDIIFVYIGQNYDYNLNGIFFKDLKLKELEVYMDVVGDDFGLIMGNIISVFYKFMLQVKFDVVFVFGDINLCLLVIGVKCLYIFIFYMEVGNRCKDENFLEEINCCIVDIISDVNFVYSEYVCCYFVECGLLKERIYVIGLLMVEVFYNNFEEIEVSDIYNCFGFEKGKYIFFSVYCEENIDLEKNFILLFWVINVMVEKYDMLVFYSCYLRSCKCFVVNGF